MSALAAARRFADRVNREGTLIRVDWTETTGGTVKPDTKARTGGTTVPKTLTFKAFTHTSEADVRARQFAQVEEGERFLDFIPGTLDSLRRPAAGTEVNNVVFTVDGEPFTQRKLGQGFSPYTDALHAGVAIASTVRVVRKQ